MNPRNTFLLVALAAGLFAFIFFYERHRTFVSPAPPKLLPGLKAWAVTSIQIQLRGMEEIRAERTNDSWLITRPINYPAQALAVDNLLRALQELVPQGHISAQELRDNRNVNAEYGFETPFVTLVIQQGDEQRQLKLGNYTAPGDQVYAQIVGSEGVDIVGTNLFQFIPRQPSDWQDRVFVNWEGKIFDRLTVTNGAKSFELRSDGTNSIWHMMPHDRVNITKLANLFTQLQMLMVQKFVKDDPKADLESYGLQPPELELDFDRGTNHLLKLQFGKISTNDPGLVYARREGRSAIVLLSAELVKGWRDEKLEFRDRTLAGMYTWAPDEIVLTGRDNFTVRRVSGDAWRVTAPYDFPADTNLMKSFITRLARLQVVPTNGPIAVKDIVPPSEWTNYGLASPSWKYILKRNITNSPGEVSNSVMAELDFGAIATNDTIYARRPEEPSVYAVALTNFQKLPVSGFQLHERRIWNFTEDQVNRIIVRQDGVPMVLDHKAANSWTLPPGSQGSINSLAVEVGAQELGVLAAENFVERGDQNRAAFGFTEKSLQITVMGKKAGGAETLTLDFGGWSPRGLRYGEVELDGQKWIFEIPAVVYDRIMYCFSIHEDSQGATVAPPAAVTPATNGPAKK